MGKIRVKTEGKIAFLLGLVLALVSITFLVGNLPALVTKILPDVSLVQKEPPRCLGCNVVFVSIDTLRAKNLGVYGYERNTSLTLDELAQKGTLFTNAVSVSSWTLPATMSWFTGVYPSQHGVTNKEVFTNEGDQETAKLNQRSPNLKTLAEVLGEAGYRTAAFTGGAGVNHEFGFDQGFEVYTDKEDFAGFSTTVPQTLSWIKEHQDEKIFVFLHGYDVHGQHIPEGGYDRRFVDFDYQGSLTGSKEEQKELREEGLTRGQLFLTDLDVRFLTALYDEKIQRADEGISRFIEELEKLELMQETVFVITSDHGEELFEHGQIDHGHSLYEELIHVPLMIIVPGAEGGKVIDVQVRSIDLFPTILDLVLNGIPETINGQLAGTSLLPVMVGEQLFLDAFPETDYRYYTFLRSARTSDGFKYIRNVESEVEELYNLSDDPTEERNLTDERRKIRLQLHQKLQEHARGLSSRE